MSRSNLWMIALITSAALAACAPGKSPTPPEVTAEYHALLDSVAALPPEVAVGTLQEFLVEHEAYDIVTAAESDLAALRAATDGRYHEARELARDGHFDQAGRILEGLARFTPGTTDGQSAKQFLQFDFYYLQAQWLLMRQRHEECRVVATKLLEHDLNAYQTNQVEMMLDSAGFMDVAMSQAEAANAQSACRQLLVMLFTQYVEEGAYPRTFSITDLADWAPHDSEYILRGISAIEGYRSTEDNVSFTAVSSSGRERIRVVDGRIMD